MYPRPKYTDDGECFRMVPDVQYQAMYGNIVTLAEVEGTITIHKGVACLPDGTTINLLTTKTQAEGRQA